MTNKCKRSILACIGIWMFASVVIVFNSFGKEATDVLEAMTVECYLTIILGAIIIVLIILDKGADNTERKNLTHVDKARNCLTAYSFDGHRDMELLNDAIRYIMREKAERKAKAIEAKRLADRKASRVKAERRTKEREAKRLAERKASK